MNVPTACSLEPAAARSQIGEWQDLFERCPEPAERVLPERLQVILPPDVAVVVAALNLALREKACCPLFRFTFEAETDHFLLVVEVPAESAVLLDFLATRRSES